MIVGMLCLCLCLCLYVPLLSLFSHWIPHTHTTILTLSHTLKQIDECVRLAKIKAKKDQRGALFQLKRKKMISKQRDQIYGTVQQLVWCSAIV
jgi:hypothetical protein